MTQKKWKKKISSLLIILFLMQAMVACGDDSATTSSSLPDTQTHAEDDANLEEIQEAESIDEGTPSEGAQGIDLSETVEMDATQLKLSDIPAYSGSPYVVINGNEPFFKDTELTTEAFERYSALDSLGRCGVAYANICNEIMPNTARESIGSVKPTGWQMAKYDFVDGKYLYNRCHLIGFQLAGENANAQNLITGTRYLNVSGMLPFENQVADYARYTGNHVLYRVTPIFEGNELVARGVLMEARSVETDSIRFCVYCYNVQPGVTINYTDGSNRADGTAGTTNNASASNESAQSAASAQGANDASAQNTANQAVNKAEVTSTYVLNTNSHKFHDSGCRAVKDILQSNRADVSSTRSALMAQGYSPCGICKP